MAQIPTDGLEPLHFPADPAAGLAAPQSRVLEQRLESLQPLRHGEQALHAGQVHAGILDQVLDQAEPGDLRGGVEPHAANRYAPAAPGPAARTCAGSAGACRASAPRR